MSIQRRILFNTASNIAAKAVAVVVGLLLTPFILQHLGPGEFGLWALVGSVVAYGSLLDLGIAAAVIKYVAQYHAEGHHDEVRAIIATALWLYTGLGLVAAGLGVAFAPIFPDLFAVAPEGRATATTLVAVMGIGVAVSIPCAITSAVLRGLQRNDLAGLLSTAGTLLFAIGTVGVFRTGGGVLGLAVVGIATTLLVQVPGLLLIRRAAPEVRFRLGGGKRSLARRLTSFGALLLVEDVMWRLQTKTDEVVIGAFLSVSAVTPYSIARRIAEMPQMVTNQFMAVLMPVASQLHAERDARLRTLYVTGSRLTLAVVTSAALTVMMLAPMLLSAWVGPEYADAALILMILALSTTIDTSTWPASAVLQGMARYRAIAAFSVVEAGANLALSLWLVRRLGPVGVALGTLVPAIVVRLGLVMPYALRTMRVSRTEAASAIFVPALLPVLPTAAFLWLVSRTFVTPSLITLALTAFAACTLYGVVYFAVGASRLERDLVHDQFRRLRVGFGRASDDGD